MGVYPLGKWRRLFSQGTPCLDLVGARTLITSDGWFDWCERHPGPPNKDWSGTNAIAAVVMHSAVGTGDGVVNIVMGPLQKSVTGVIYYSGELVQFYPVTACPWANGSPTTNRAYLGFENEGGEDTPETVHEPQTDEQLATSIRILRDLAVYKGVGIDFWQRPVTLKEHREFYPTACPSGRIRWDDILAGLQPPAAPTIAGIGVRYDDDSTTEIWTPVDGKTLTGVGARLSDGSEVHWWP